MRVVGITGGIGSGKSALAAAFAELGVPVVDADRIARRCVEPGTPVLAAIEARFGSGVIDPDGGLDRAALAAIVFADDAARRSLEALTHPCIRGAITAEIEALRARPDAPAVAVVELPLLVEGDGELTVDVVVVVEASLEARLQRLTTRRGMMEAEARARIAAQTDDAARRAVADVIVVNDGDIARLHDEAARILAFTTSSGVHREGTAR